MNFAASAAEMVHWARNRPSLWLRLWVRLMRLQPLPSPFLFAGKIGRRQVRRDSVSEEFRSLFRGKGIKLASSRQIIPEIGFCVISGYTLALFVRSAPEEVRQVSSATGTASNTGADILPHRAHTPMHRASLTNHPPQA